MLVAGAGLAILGVSGRIGEAGGWGLYAGGGLSPMEPVLSEGTTVLEHSPFFGSGGLSFSPR